MREKGMKKILGLFFVMLMVGLFSAEVKATEEPIARGAVDETYGQIRWEIDGEGKLTVIGNGDVSESSSANRVPWYSYTSKIKSAEIDVIGMTNASYLFANCSNMTSVDLSEFDTSNVTTMRSMFDYCSKLTDLDLSEFDTSNVVDTGWMFYRCSGLTTLDVSEFDTSSITDMSYMFRGCSSLNTIDVSNWNTANVQSMGSLFAECSGLTKLDVSEFDITNVTDINSMFYKCSGLESINVRGFNTDKVTNMNYVFYKCSSMEYLDLGNWDMSKVTFVTNMLNGCTGLKWVTTPKNVAKEISLPVEDDDQWYTTEENVITKLPKSQTNEALLVKNEMPIAYGFIDEDYGQIIWIIDSEGHLTVTGVGDVSRQKYTEERIPWYSKNNEIISAKVEVKQMTDASYLFYQCENMIYVDVSGLDTSRVTDMRSMFCGCSSLTELDVSNFDTSNVTGMSGMFSGCSNLIKLDLNNFDTSNVTSMQYIFSGCSNLIQLDLDNFDTSNITSTFYMFEDCKALEEVDVSGFDTEKVTWMGSMFNGCNSLKTLDVSGFNTSNVTNMEAMFSGCHSLEELDVSGFDTGKVTNMQMLFENCWSLDELDVSNFNTENVEYMYGIFEGCAKLRKLDLNSFSTKSAKYMAQMFYGCRLLKELDISSFDMSNVASTSSMFAFCDNLEKINTPINCQMSVALPVKTESYQWTMADGTLIQELPQELSESILIVRNYTGIRAATPTLTLVQEDGGGASVKIQNNDEEFGEVYVRLVTIGEIVLDMGPAPDTITIWLASGSTNVVDLAELLSKTLHEPGEYYIVASTGVEGKDYSEIAVLENYPVTIVDISKEENIEYQRGDITGNLYFTTKSVNEYEYSNVHMSVEYGDGYFGTTVWTLDTRNNIFYLNAKELNNNYKKWSIDAVTFGKVSVTQDGCTVENEFYTSVIEGENYKESRAETPTITMEIIDENQRDIYVQNNDEEYSEIYCGLVAKEELESGEWEIFSSVWLENSETYWFTSLSYMLRSQAIETGDYYIVGYAENENEVRSELMILEDYPITVTMIPKEETLEYHVGTLTGRAYFIEKSSVEYDYAEAEIMVTDEQDDSWMSEMTLGTNGEMISFDAGYLNNNYKNWNIEKVTFSKINASDLGCAVEKEIYTSVVEGETYEEERTEKPAITLNRDEDGTVNGIYVQNADEEFSEIYYGLATKEEIASDNVRVYSSEWLENSQTVWGSGLNDMIQSADFETGEYYIVGWAENENKPRSELTVIENYPITIVRNVMEDPIACQIGNVSGSTYFPGKKAEDYSRAEAKVQLYGGSPYESVELNKRDGIFFMNADEFYYPWYYRSDVKEVTFENVESSKERYSLTKNVYTSLDISEDFYEEERAVAPEVQLLYESGSISGIEIKNTNEEYSCIHFGFLTQAEMDAGDVKSFYSVDLETLETHVLSLEEICGIMHGSVWFEGPGEYYFMAYTHSDNGARSQLTVIEEYPLIITENLMEESLSFQTYEETGDVYFVGKTAEGYIDPDIELVITERDGTTREELYYLYKAHGLFYLENERYRNVDWAIKQVTFGEFAATETGFFVERKVYTSFVDEGIFEIPQKNNIASGVIDEECGQITWEIDNEGKLTVSGTGDFTKEKSESVFERQGKIPWSQYREDILGAKINIKEMTDASCLFLWCEEMEEIDLAEFDTSNVEDMAYLFADCVSLEKLDLKGFDTSKVENMSYMFQWYSPVEDLDFGGFDTSKVTDMSGMFGYVGSRSKVKKLDLSNFDTSNVTDMSFMFANCFLENINISGFDMRNVTKADSMLHGCENLVEIQAPLNCSVEVELPTTSEEDKWYLPDGTVITHLPQGLTQSVTITKKPKTPVTEVFSDVTSGSWYINAVQYVYDNGIMSGSEGLFTPNNEVSRAMVVETLYKMEGKPEVTVYTNYEQFTDLKSDHWWKNSVAWALNEGVATGDTYDKTFSPKKAVTREQIATFLYRYADMKGLDVSLSRAEEEILGDVEVGKYAKTAFAWAIDQGLISGREEMDSQGNKYFDLSPKTGATRAQMATILMRFCEKYDI